MLDDLWAPLATTLGIVPSLPSAAIPAANPESWGWSGEPAWEAINEVLKRLGCAIAYDPTKKTGQYSIVQIGATDAATAKMLTSMEQDHLAHDGDFQGVVRGKVPYGVRVFFRKLRYIGSAPLLESNYTVDVVGPDPTTAQAGVYTPIWDDLPAVYDYPGNLTNSAALATRANERAADFYRMLTGNGGTRLWRIFSGIHKIVPGSTIKGVSWRMDFQGIGGGPAGSLVTEVIRTPFYDLGVDDSGEWKFWPGLGFRSGRPIYQMDQAIACCCC
jgi:hypothetical protein